MLSGFFDEEIIMDFSLSRKQEVFRDEVRSFFNREKQLAKEALKEYELGQGFGSSCWEMLQKVGERGWLCPTWPKKYGGLELSFMYRYLIQEEMHRAIGLFSTVGAGMAGPIIMKQGSKEQKEKYLLPIAKGEVEFALGYTEPDAGSDLASLKIQAEDKGDYFLLNGEKMFNTRVHFAQYHWLGVRTKEILPLHKGISLMIVDLKNTPGIKITPYYTLSGTRTNGIFYDNVKVPKKALVGEKNKGFYYILEALAYERIVTVAGLERDFNELVDFVKSSNMGKDPLIRQKMADLAIDVEAVRLFALKVAWMLDNDVIPSHEAAMLKIHASETDQKLVNIAMQIMGPYGQLKKGSKWAQLDGKFEWRYKDSLEFLIVMGTSEILRNVIADRGLGLPRV